MKKKVLLGEPGGKAVGGAALPGARPGRHRLEALQRNRGMGSVEAGLQRGGDGSCHGGSSAGDHQPPRVLLFQLVMVSRDMCSAIIVWVEP